MTVAHIIIGGSGGGAGVTGPRGATGPQGIQGLQGIQGSPGVGEGGLGSQGSPGVTGPQGATGPQGIQGVQGDQGIQGVQGDAGSNGSNGAQGIQGSPGVTGPIGPSANGISYGGAITTGPTGPMLANIPGLNSVYSGGSIDITARQTVNRATVKSTAYTTQFELTTTSTGWNNAHVFTYDDNSINKIVATVQAIQSSPTPGLFAANFVMEANVKRWNNTTVFVPTGVGPIMLTNRIDQPTGGWGLTMVGTGATGVVQVQGGSGTVQFGGWIAHTKTSV